MLTFSRGRYPQLRNTSVNPDPCCSTGERGREYDDALTGEEVRRLAPPEPPLVLGAAVAGRFKDGLPARPPLNIGLVVVCGAAATRRPGLAPRPPVAPPSGEAGSRFIMLLESEYPVEC